MRASYPVPHLAEEPEKPEREEDTFWRWETSAIHGCSPSGLPSLRLEIVPLYGSRSLVLENADAWAYLSGTR